jgi:hypothetical protein
MGTVGRSYDPTGQVTLQTIHHVVRPMGWGMPCVVRTIISLQ